MRLGPEFRIDGRRRPIDRQQAVPQKFGDGATVAPLLPLLVLLVLQSKVICAGRAHFQGSLRKRAVAVAVAANSPAPLKSSPAK